MRLLRQLLIGLVMLLALAWIALAIYAYWPGEPEVPARQLATAADHFVSVDGMALRYRTWGERDPGRPNLLLIHGFANSLQSFRLLAPMLAEHFHVVTVDAPGFGLSAKPAEHDYGNASQAKAIADFAAALGLERYVVGGHSMGGTLAVYVAASDPHVTGLVLMNPGIISTGVPAVTRYLFWPLPRVMARMFGSRAFREDFLKRSFLDPSIVTPQVMDAVMLAPRSAGYLDGMASMMGQYRSGDEPAMASRVRVPTLIVWGMQDRSKLPGEQQQLQRLIPGSRLVEVPDSGHYVQEEQPAAVAAALIAEAPAWR
ncbi:4,5:9,10-diseco-3-hydroxy-5,9, 17-trioxoandrosta-1(10),2-diene-4-oate hydrolase [Gammaproteobacteria bacterium]|nr:MAG: alpha/beta hydrolase [Gammaproteobacteria bacterium]CAG0939626.1 4,5:9,10-diseco-3-hydroxy-5,9, 17-trioxoandrosta-1(10),2-diene-4-oate hydrolase [Gammaproteobacteria bacterium]